MHRRKLYLLTLVAGGMSLGHHLDHVVRGNHVGWPVSGEVNAFTASLAIYPIVVTGLLLYRAGIVGAGFWALVSSGGAAFLGFLHFGPMAIEPPADIIDLYASPILGWFWFSWLVAFVALLAITSTYETRLWYAERRTGSVLGTGRAGS